MFDQLSSRTIRAVGSVGRFVINDISCYFVLVVALLVVLVMMMMKA